ncbi:MULTISPECIES: ABC transporter ATP-binding protein [Brevibacterium]|uniref:Peptide/nickel transport system ATP-binding protein n=2 Tax=Brevibacterium antiquum TaxID=234835 RepID=A0A2H1KAA7_9MICO|nr:MULTISPECIES: ABC transporter ATP-binding protein [Brevibacterium]SMX79832.1 peptide/nickel transport system ATP-binding protein [Brevibacterium antiquum]SMX96747.1 peptide/nickel transport system ATP-binding protein [Brevibacterium antiquum CNRZ 918]HCG55793.1 ABC transporter ATP-binding protein [Brevibacterium sp.]
MTEKTSTPKTPILEVKDLGVNFWVSDEWWMAAEELNYTVNAGEVLAIVGESGSGKSQSSMSLLGLLPSNGRATGSAKMGGTELIGMSQDKMQQIRGNEISVIFQEPMTALNPVYTAGFQIVETLRVHLDVGPTEAKERALELMRLVEIPDPEERFHSFPHQLSGGQRQRIMIAQALACQPKLLIADEPTTALDVTVQAEILKLMRELKSKLDAGIILITHDMGVVADMADRMIVMKAGRVVESGNAEEIFYNPQHPYTKQLLEAVPHLGAGTGGQDYETELTEAHSPSSDHDSDGRPNPHTDGGRTPVGTKAPGSATVAEGGANRTDDLAVEAKEIAESGQPSFDIGMDSTETYYHPGSQADFSKPSALQLRDAAIEYPAIGRKKAFRAAHHINLMIAPGEVVGLVGESGSGKTTIGRAALGLLPTVEGDMVVNGKSIKGLSNKAMRPLRKEVGIVFQDPGSSLNPRLPVGESIGEPLYLHEGMKGPALSKSVEELLTAVELPTSMRNRYPHELSGGQRQRIGIARALTLRPKLLIADEPTSALDVSVQAKVLDLFEGLQQEYGFACLFISHDLAVIERIASRIAVMRHGYLVEIGESSQVVTSPVHPYTRRLLSAVPVPDPREQRKRREARDAVLEATANA